LHSVSKTNLCIFFACGHYHQDSLEGKSAEFELPKFRKADSASNSLAALSYRPWNQNIMLSKPFSPADLEGLNYCSPRSSIRNNGFPEVDGYQIPEKSANRQKTPSGHKIKRPSFLLSNFQVSNSLSWTT